MHYLRILNHFVVFYPFNYNITPFSNSEMTGKDGKGAKKRLFADNDTSCAASSKLVKVNEDEGSETQSNRSHDLLSSPASVTAVSSSAPSLLHRHNHSHPTLVTVKETQLSEPREKGRTGGRRDAEEDSNVAEGRNEHLLRGIKEDVECALVFYHAFGEKIAKVHELVATAEEVSEFKNKLQRKLHDVAKVAEKGVVLEKVTMYRVMKKED